MSFIAGFLVGLSASVFVLLLVALSLERRLEEDDERAQKGSVK